MLEEGSEVFIYRIRSVYLTIMTSVRQVDCILNIIGKLAGIDVKSNTWKLNRLQNLRRQNNRY
jgi:hypothetical protein